MPKKKTTLIRSADFKTIYAVGAIGTWTPYDFRINFYSEKVVEDEEDAFVNDTQVILSPKATKEFALWLLQNIKDYEETYGKPIPTDSILKPEEGGAFKSDLRSELKSDLRTELQADVQKIIDSDFKDTIKKDLGAEIKTDLRKYIKQNLHNDLKKDLRVMPTPQLKKDLKKVLKADLKQDLKQDLRKDIRKDLEKEFQRNLRTTAVGTTQTLKTKSRPAGETVKSSKGSDVGKKTSTTTKSKLSKKKK